MLKIWFLNVGHGDCTIIEHPSGRITMIDINNSQSYDEDSQKELVAEETAKHLNALAASYAADSEMKRELTDPIAFFKQQFGNRSLFRFILTHPDMDHMRGIKNLFEQVEVVNFWDTSNTKPTPSFWKSGDRSDWEFYQTQRRSAKNYVRGSQVYAFAREDDGSLGGDGLTILSPTSGIIQSCNEREFWNDISVVLRLDYAGKSFIFPGDAEAGAWDQMVAHYGDGLKADLLKASHHGRDSGFHTKAIQAIAPNCVVTSVGRKPTTDAHTKYKYHAGSVFSTRYYGNIYFEVYPDGSWFWQAERNQSVHN
jgi:beta-lactamase superfamily II metal-dependent hydrolase